MSLTIKNIAVNVVYYGVTVVLIPWIALSLERRLGVIQEPPVVLQVAAIVLLAIGAVLQLWCIVVFQVAGRGTPSPAFPPRALVLRGPYAWCRNPMNVGELFFLLGLAAWFASPTLVVYSIAVGCAFHTFIVMYEEPTNIRRFGQDYAQYITRVNRWIPLLWSETTPWFEGTTTPDNRHVNNSPDEAD
jgi:protein-S-isoprenylcysteine O-methyltransferase Ste14